MPIEPTIIGRVGVDGSSFDEDTFVLDLKSTGDTTSESFAIGKTLGRASVIARASGDIVVPATKSIVITVESSDDNITFTTKSVITIPASTIADSDMLFSFTPDEYSKKYIRFKFTTSYDGSAQKVKVAEYQS